MSNYSRGRGLEYEVKKVFEDAGWHVIRGSSSKGEVFGIKADLVATKESGQTKKSAVMVIVQCKLARKQKRSRGWRGWLRAKATSVTAAWGGRRSRCA